MVSFSGNDTEFRDRVRASLGGIDPDFIKDSNIDEQKDGKVIPYIDRSITNESDKSQDDIDNAIVTYTAYRAFSSVPLMSTISGGGLTANMAPQQYRKELRQDAAIALEGIDITLPEKGSPAPVVDRTDGMLRDD